MKKIVTIFVLSIVLIFGLIGCSPQQQGSVGANYQDQAFLTDLVKGLEARWAINDKNKETDTETSSTTLQEAIRAEKDKIDKYRTAEFEDTKLQELAVRYLNTLDESMDIAEKFSSNDYECIEAWSKTYGDRTMVLNEIASNYDLKVSSKYQKYLDDLIANGKTAQSNSDNDEAVQKLANAIEIVFETDSHGYTRGNTTITNTSNLNFEYIGFDVQLYDDSGVRTDTSSLYVNNWKSGETIAEEVYIGKEDAPAKYVVVPSGYSLVK